MIQEKKSCNVSENPFTAQKVLDMLVDQEAGLVPNQKLVPNTRFAILNSVHLSTEHVVFAGYDEYNQDLLNECIQEFMSASGDLQVQILSSGIASLTVFEVNPLRVALVFEDEPSFRMNIHHTPFWNFAKTIVREYEKIGNIGCRIEFILNNTLLFLSEYKKPYEEVRKE